MREKRRHTEFGDGREDGLHGFQFNFCLRLPSQTLRKRRCHFVTHGIRNDDIDLVVEPCDLLTIEIRLLRHFDLATRLELICTGI